MSVVAACGGLFLLAIMLTAPFGTRAVGQSAPPNVRPGEHKPAAPALLATPELRAPGAHRMGREDAQAATDLVARQGPKPMFPGKPIKFSHSS